MSTDDSLLLSSFTLGDIDKSEFVYISGKMSGLPDLGKELLGKAESELNNWGYFKVLNPYNMVDQSKVTSWADCMIIDIDQILSYKVRAMVLLDNWRDSKGATLEVILFLVLGKHIFNQFGQNITDEIYRSFDQSFLFEMFVEMVKLRAIK